MSTEATITLPEADAVVLLNKQAVHVHNLWVFRNRLDDAVRDTEKALVVLKDIRKQADDAITAEDTDELSDAVLAAMGTQAS